MIKTKTPKQVSLLPYAKKKHIQWSESSNLHFYPHMKCIFSCPISFQCMKLSFPIQNQNTSVALHAPNA